VAYRATHDTAPQTGSAILVVEDEAHIRHLLVGELSAHGHPCVAVTGVAEAATRLRERRFRLILLDLILRDGRGLDLLKTISDTPVLVVSGAPSPMLREAAAVSSVRAILSKPFSLSELRAAVSRCLDVPEGGRDGAGLKSAAAPLPETVGTVAHALKNLLAIAIGEVEFLLSDEAQQDPSLHRPGLESIRRVVLDSRQLIWRLESLVGAK
jgi:DNA-binding response OmpR family regulator